ncbi:MAG: radical SAM protein [Oscillospiraceae bacterium]|nr:radical SAM protein [Oscillospiraceae bacterium]
MDNPERNSEDLQNFKFENGPLFIAFDLTLACNFRCLHCYNHSGQKQSDELSDDEVLDVAHQIAKMAPMTVCLCGGEPMLRSNLFQVIECISQTVGVVNMVTNGSLINEQNMNEMARAGLSVIQISLDGINPMQHDTLRNHPGSFSKAINAIELAKKAGLTVYVALSPNKLNYRSIPQFVELCHKLDVASVRIMPLIPMGRGHTMEKLLLSSEDYIELQLSIQNEIHKHRGSSLNLEWGDPLDHYARLPTNAQNELNSFTYEIKANGNITVSTYLPIVVGNVRKRSLVEYWEAGYKSIWSNKKVLDYISKINTIYDINQLDPKPYSGDYYFVDLNDERN